MIKFIFSLPEDDFQKLPVKKGVVNEDYRVEFLFTNAPNRYKIVSIIIDSYGLFPTAKVVEMVTGFNTYRYNVEGKPVIRISDGNWGADSLEYQPSFVDRALEYDRDALREILRTIFTHAISTKELEQAQWILLGAKAWLENKPVAEHVLSSYLSSFNDEQKMLFDNVPHYYTLLAIIFKYRKQSLWMYVLQSIRVELRLEDAIQNITNHSKGTNS